MSRRGRSGDPLPTAEDLDLLFRRKHGPPELAGWSVKRRFRYRYFLPAEIYESLVSKLVSPGCRWLDVGGGHAIFPENPQLARELVSLCERVVAVDPSKNVWRNDFVHERVQTALEEYMSDTQFDLATIRMVAEHVDCPGDFVSALGRLLKPGGTVVVLTVNRRSPISWISRLLPFPLHHPMKRLVWGGQEEDTFPVHYRMNTRAELLRLFAQAGFVERTFAKLDDLSLFGRFKRLNYLELLGWSGLRRLGISYPENCLLGVYSRRSAG